MLSELPLLSSSEYRNLLAQCIHCGLCLSACPTYPIFGTEMDNPRGRIALMLAASQNRIDPEFFEQGFSLHINRCLACRSCETACPSGVRYAELYEKARQIVEHNRSQRMIERFVRWFAGKILLPRPALLRKIAHLMKLYERIGLQKWLRSKNVLPGKIQSLEALLPPLNIHFQNYTKPFPALGEERGKVLLFTGCVQEGFLPQVNQATIRVLQHNGFTVCVPKNQTCCGAAQLHMGDIEFAATLARQNMDVFLNSGEDFLAVISNAGGCGLALKEYPHLFAGEPALQSKAQVFSSLVQDINEFLDKNLTIPPRGTLNNRATYVDSCHLRHGQKVVQQPRRLLNEIPGLKLVDISTPDLCCGSAGVYNITQPDTAASILEAKMADIKATGADLIVISNTGCHLQLITGVRHAGLDLNVHHVVEVLDQSYMLEEQQNQPLLLSTSPVNLISKS